jgi:hypothetical protein
MTNNNLISFLQNGATDWEFFQKKIKEEERKTS